MIAIYHLQLQAPLRLLYDWLLTETSLIWLARRINMNLMWRPSMTLAVLGLCHSLGSRLKSSPVTFVWGLKLLGQGEDVTPTGWWWNKWLEMSCRAAQATATLAVLISYGCSQGHWPAVSNKTTSHNDLAQMKTDQLYTVAWRVFHETETMSYY